MNRDIEYLDQQRMNYLKWFLLVSTIFMLLLLTRYFFRLGGLNSQPIGFVVLIGLVLTLIAQIIFVLQSARLERNIRQDPRLVAALNNELVKSLETQSWVAAYLGAAGMTVFFAVTWFFYPVCDPVAISLAAIAAGAIAHRASFYFRYRMS